MLGILKNKFSEKPTLYLKLPGLILMIFYLGEFISKVFKYIGHRDIRFSGGVKLIFEIFFIFYIIKFKKRSRRTLLKIGGFFFTIYFLGQVFLLSPNFLERLIVNGYSFNGYLFIFILFFSFYPETKKELSSIKLRLHYLDKTLKIIFFVNSALIMVGLIFEINLLKTYLGFSNRFGYNGLFLHASHSSYIYILLIIYFFNEYVKNNNKYNYTYLISSIVISFLIGAKTIYLFNLLFIFYFFFIYKKHSIIYLIFLLGLVSLGFFYALDILENHFNELFQVYKEHGVITMLFSYRDQSIESAFIPFLKEKWSFFNYYFGGAEFNFQRTELELLDLFWFFGFFGAFLYLRLIYKFFISSFLQENHLKIPIMIFLLCVFLAGSFFTNAPVIPYYIILYYRITHLSLVMNL